MDAGCAAVGQHDALPRALHTLLMVLNSQLRRPHDLNYHRLNVQNANLRRLVDLPGAAAVLAALGFVESGGSFWVWRGGAAPTPASTRETAAVAARTPSEAELVLIRCHKDVLAQRLEVAPTATS